MADLGPLKGECCFQPGERIRGTFYLGGAGLNGNYIASMVQAFHREGILSTIHLDRKKWSSGQYVDATIGVVFARNYDPDFPMGLRITTNGFKQFNLIGYSYGSLIVSQLAMRYATGGTKVDHLVLIGSPISAGFLKKLINHPLIKKVIVINLNQYGDPIYAGMELSELISTSPELIEQWYRIDGHFYYATEDNVGNARRQELAKQLYQAGLR